MTGRNRTRAATRWLVAALTALVVVLPSAACGPQYAGPSPTQATTRSGPTADPMPRSEPVSLDITAIDVHAPIGRLGLTPQHTVEVPPLERPGEVGWYINGPTPGQLGAAVILGHVDSKAGPSVFFRLHQLKPGDLIKVERSDGTTATFATTAVEQTPKTAFPTDRVYGDTPEAGLRLVTCGGAFDRSRGSYLDNVIAYAVLVR